jgi:flagellin
MDLQWAIVNDTSSLYDYVNGGTSGESFAAFVTRVANEDKTTDTGAIDGSNVAAETGGSGTAKDSVTIVQGNGTYNPQPLSADFGWTVVWPTEITATDAGSGDTKLAISAARNDTLQAVNGTLLLHSNIAGLAGRISISGDENLIKALGFAEIQSARDTVYDVRITDAHSGKLLTSGVRISGGTMYGVLHENIDVRLTNNFAIGFDDSNLRADGYGTYDFEQSGRNSFVVHIASNSVVLQIGANQGEDMVISFGDVSTTALGVDKVSVRDRELAARAVTVIDNAISKVSTKRARLGAYQNRLEHTITNLTAASANTAASESRIRDADMAKEIINFTRLNILSQAGNSMLGQANQLPQNVLMLLR